MVSGCTPSASAAALLLRCSRSRQAANCAGVMSEAHLIAVAVVALDPLAGPRALDLIGAQMRRRRAHDQRAVARRRRVVIVERLAGRAERAAVTGVAKDKKLGLVGAKGLGDQGGEGGLPGHGQALRPPCSRSARAKALARHTSA